MKVLLEIEQQHVHNQTKKSVIGFDLKNKWQQFFIPRLN